MGTTQVSRIGVAILDTATGRIYSRRGEARFPTCNPAKFLLAACVLWRVDRGLEALDRRLIFSEAELLAHSPVTKWHAGGDGMTMEQLCHAIITQSDNTAAGLLLAGVSGPGEVAAFARCIGEAATTPERIEPALRTVEPGDRRDAFSPLDSVQILRRIARHDALSPASRQLLSDWLMANLTGAARLRAGVPGGRREGHGASTAAAKNQAKEDFAVLWPIDRAPQVVAADYAFLHLSRTERDKVLAWLSQFATTG